MLDQDTLAKYRLDDEAPTHPQANPCDRCGALYVAPRYPESCMEGRGFNPRPPGDVICDSCLKQFAVEHAPIICTSDDPTNHQGDTCPIHEYTTSDFGVVVDAQGNVFTSEAVAL